MRLLDATETMAPVADSGLYADTSAQSKPEGVGNSTGAYLESNL